MSHFQTSNLLSAMARTGHLSKTNQMNTILSDKVRDDNIVRFNNVIGNLMKEKQEQKQISETPKPSEFKIKKEGFDYEVKTDADRIVEEKNLPRPLHSGHLYDNIDDNNESTRSISVSVDVVKIVVFIIVGFVLVIVYMKLNTVLDSMKKIDVSVGSL